MEQNDLLEILATAAVTDIAHELRNAHMVVKPGKPPLSDFFEEAAQMMRRRRKAIIPMLK